MRANSLSNSQPLTSSHPFTIKMKHLSQFLPLPKIMNQKKGHSALKSRNITLTGNPLPVHVANHIFQQPKKGKKH